jgi:phenylacetate-CoA ligase
MVPDGETSGAEAAMSLPARLFWTAQFGVRRITQSRFPFRSPAAIERAQRRNIREMVRYAHRHVPYYRETMRRLGLGPDDFRSAADLGRLPLIEREQLQRDPLCFVSQKQPLERCRKLQTGGSSGAPIVVMRSPVRPRELAYQERSHAVERKLTGKRWGARMLDIASPLSPGAASRRTWRKRLMPPSFLATERLELSLLDPPSKALAVMNEFRPDLILSYGSYIEALFQHARRSGGEFHRPAVVVYHSDSLAEAARRMIEDDLEVEVLNYYSAVEAPAIGFECEQHRGFHLNCDLHPVRIVGDDGEELPDGEGGEVVVSNLVNRATVLLNYRIGDVASKLPGGCACGRSLPLMSFLEGRVGDWVQTRDGERIHPQAVRVQFTQEDEVWRYQVVQRSPSHFSLSLVVSPDCDRGRLEARLAAKFAELFGEGTTIDVSFVDSIARTPRGKVRTVIAMADSQGVTS